MKKFRNVLYQFLIVFIAFSSIRVMAVGEQYIDTYNTLLKGIQDRGGLTSNQPKQQGDSVTQGDLNILRGAVTSLAKNFFVIDGGPGPFGTETEANAIFKPLYYKDTKGTPDISDDEWKFTTLDRDFIKVPAKYTKLKKNIISNSFTDVPVLWQHFTDMTTVLNAMELKKITLSISVDVAKNNTEWWIRECCYIGSEYYDSWFRLLPEDGGYLEWAMLAFSSASYTKTDMPLPDIFKERVKADHFLTLSSSSTINNVSEFKQYFLRYTHGTSIDNSYMWIIDNKSLGQEISLENSLPPEMMGEPPAQMWDSNNYNYYKEIIAHWFFAKLNVSSVSISNPSQTMDSSNNDVVLAGCVTCKLGESFIKQFNDAGMSAQFPTGMSSGFDSGLIVFSYLTNYKLGDFKYSHHSLNTSIMADYNGTEPDGNKWQFTLIQRPRGAQVLMGWINWSGDIPDKAEAINGGGYDLKVRNSERIIKFSDNVVHVFPSGTGALVRCEKMVDDELLKVTPPGSSLSITGGNNPTEVTSWGLLKSKPTYNTDGTCSAVYYYVVVAGYDIPFAKFTVEYTTQTLAQRSIPDVYYVADASALINASLFATDPPPAQEVEVQVYRYYKYIDGAYVLQSETKNSVDENGNPTSEEYNVDNGSTTSVAQKTTYSKLESTDPRVTINQKTVTEGTNTFVTISKEKAFPWGNEVIENIEGFGTANEKTTVYTYGENEYITPPDPADPTVIPVLDPSYGKIKSIQYPDGSWIRNEYDSEGRTIKEITPIGNAAIDASENLCKVTEYDYTAYVTGDTVETGDFRPRLVVTKKLGFEISRSYQGFLDHEHRSIECQTAGAAWNATDNLVTYKYSYPDGHAFAGRHWKTVYPDGTMSITSYAKTTDTFTTTVDRGAGSGDTVTDGVRSISAMNTKGWTTSSQTVDIASGLAISSATYQHDDYGRVTRTDYADGTYTTTAYACCGPSQRVNREGTATDIMYDALKRVINRETDGIATLYSYDADGNVLTTTLKGRLGTEKTTTNTYNDAGELVSKTTPDNKTTTYSESWVDGVRYSTTTYPNNTTQITKYNLDGTVAETYGTAVRHVKYEYGVENGEQYTKTINVGENGSETNWTKTYINFSGKAYKTVTSSGATTLTEFDSLGRAVKKTAPNGVITLTEYNTKGEACASAVDMNQNGVIDYAGTDRVTGIERVYESKNGTVVSKQTQSVYATDSSATPTVTSVSENAVDGSASWQTSFGNVTSSQTVLSGSGQKTITVTNPDNSTVTTVYLNGRMTSSTHSVLGTTTYTYDEFNRTSTITHAEDGVDKVTTYAYNAAGQVESITLSSGTESKVTSYTYDDMGRRTSATLPGGRTVNYTYAPTGELLTVSGADTYPQTYTYDPLGRMKTLLTYRTYPGTADTTTWNYDPSSGFMTSKVYANGKGTTYTYNNAGQLATRLWARGITTTYGYDNGGAKNSIDYSDTTTDISFTYDRLGRTKTVTDAAGTRTNTYDANLRLTSSTIPNILNTKLEYAYDSLGRMSSMNLEQDSTDKLTLGYTYDAMSRIATVSDGTNTAEYTRLTGTNLLNTVTVKQGATTIVNTTKDYDAFNRLLSTSSVAGGTPRTYSYVYNDKDQRTKLTLPDGSYWEYAYDDKGQVTSGIKKDSSGKAIPGQSFGYSFDDIGNRKTASKGMPEMLYNYTANNVNQYTQMTIPGYVPIAGSAATDATVRIKDADTGQVYTTTRDGNYFSKAVPVSNTTADKEANLEIHAVKFDAAQDKDIVKTITGKYMVYKTPETFTYDDDGNMTSDGEWTYTYNGENRPVTVINADNTKKFEYKYDYAGRRIEEKYYISSGTWTLSKHLKFVYQGFKKIAEYDGSDSLQKLYTWQPVSLDVPLWVKDGTNYYYYIADANKNIRAMVDVLGNEVAGYDYKPFGVIASQSGSYADDNMYRFSSEYYCPVLKSSDYGLRDYSFILARWRTRDPIGEKGGYNLYGMTGNDTVNKWDLLGLSDVFAYSVELWDWDWWGHDLVARFVFYIQYTCEGGKVSYISPMSPKAKVIPYDLQGAKTASGIIPKKIYEDGSAVEFTLWAAGSWEEFNKEDGWENAERIINLFQADKQPRPVIVSIALGVYIAEGNLRAIKRTATFSKKVYVYCCKDGKRGPILETKNDQVKKDGDGDGDLFWDNAEELNMDGSVTNPLYR